MRNIFCKTITETQQGCIFNGAKADGFEDCTVYGLIITPRCDIAQCKVMTVHYLPIVKFEDWKRIILTQVSQLDRLNKKKVEVLDLCNKFKIPVHLIEKQYRLSDDNLEKIIHEKKFSRR